MQQAVFILVVGCLLVGAFVGVKVGKARSSHTYYRRVKESMPGLRKSAWADIRNAVGVIALVVFLLVVFVYGITAQG
jgi:cobalamin biosynthesis protein CobD/CbiB